MNFHMACGLYFECSMSVICTWIGFLIDLAREFWTFVVLEISLSGIPMRSGLQFASRIEIWALLVKPRPHEECDIRFEDCPICEYEFICNWPNYDKKITRWSHMWYLNCVHNLVRTSNIPPNWTDVSRTHSNIIASCLWEKDSGLSKTHRRLITCNPRLNIAEYRSKWLVARSIRRVA